MYTGGWEVVGKNKKDKNTGKTGKLTKAEKKKFIENAPKVEDFLPLDQVKTLYDLDGNKENKQNVKEKEHKTNENEERKKHQKPQVEKKKDEPPKVKPPKSIEEALNLIDSVEVQNLIAANQSHFPNTPLIWLKSLTAFLNAKIPVDKEDAIFSGKPNNYPLNIVPTNLRIVLEKAIETAGASNIRPFYEFILTIMAVEMGRGTSVVGYKIFIQILAKYDPKLTVANIPKLISMRNSYQNRKHIGLSLLWAFNQGGREDLSVGLTVWHEVMAPMLETKSYSNYVIQILNDLLKWHADEVDLEPDLYLSIFEDFISGKWNISQSVIEEGALILQKLRLILFQNKHQNYGKLFITLFFSLNSKTPEKFRTEIINALTNCLIADNQCFGLWKLLHMKNLWVSTVLLSHIDATWDSLVESINSTSLSDILATFQLSYGKPKKGKGNNDKYLYTCNITSEALVKKMLSKKSNTNSFPWKTGCFLIFILIAAIVAYDIQKQGSFEATSTGRFIRDSGIAAGIQEVWLSTKLYSAKGLEYLEASSPEYYRAISNFSKPYIKLSGDFYFTSKRIFMKIYNNTVTYASTHSPMIITTTEHYLPGAIEFIQHISFKGFEIIKIYSAFITKQVIENSAKTTRWLKTNVFVGMISPENLQNYASQAINTTYTFANQTYKWVYEKVQTLSKFE